MKYKKNIFGKTVEQNEDKNSFLHDLEKSRNPTIRGDIKSLHFLSGIFFVWEVFLLIEIFLKIPMTFSNKILTIFFDIIFPISIGIVKIKFIDPFFDSFTIKIKYIFMVVVFTVFGIILWYVKTH